MPTYNDIKSGNYITVEGQPYQVIETTYIQMQQRRPTVEMRLKNLRTGQVVSRTFKSQHDADEADIEREPIVFIYENRGEYWFRDPDDPSSRFSLKEELIGDAAQFLKPDLEVSALKYDDEVINIELPIKVDYEVVEAPPGIKGDTASGGTKPVVIDSASRTRVSAPLFINQGDVIRVNTHTGTYDERVEKSAGL